MVLPTGRFDPGGAGDNAGSQPVSGPARLCHKPRRLTKSRIVTVCDAAAPGAAKRAGRALRGRLREWPASALWAYNPAMSRAQFYIMRQVAVATLYIAVTLTVVVWLTQSTRFFKLILNRGMSLDIFLELTSLLVPSFLLITLPIALFLATVFVLTKMLNDRELVVMRSAGLSDLDLAMPVVTLGVAGVTVCYFISLYLLPVSFKQFRDLQDDVRNNFSVRLIQEGAFTNYGEKLTIYVRERVGDEVRGILVQDNRDKARTVTMMAERGTVTFSETGPRVLMGRGNRQERDRETGRISTLYFERYSFDFALGKPRKRSFIKPNERFLGDLLRPGDSAGDRRNRSRLIAEGHNRLIAPLYAMTLPVLALVIMLAGQFNKRGQAVRTVLVLTAAGLCEGAAIGLSNSAAKHNALIPLAYANALVPMIGGMVLLVRTDWLSAVAGTIERLAKGGTGEEGPAGA